MGNIPLKRLKIPSRLLPGKSESKMLGKLNIPGIDITYLKSYQYQTKALRVEGYNLSRPSPKKRKEYRLNINGFKAWKIGFKSRLQVSVDLILYFTIYLPDGLVYDHTQTCKNPFPNKEAKVTIIPALKTAR